MHKLKMKATRGLTFEEGCNKYLEYCRQRNLRQGTINHYRQSYVQFFKFFTPDTPIEEIDEDAYKRYVLYLCSTLNNDVSINSYLRDFITTMHYLMNEGYYFVNDMIVNLFPLSEIVPRLECVKEKEFVEVMIHEQYFYDYFHMYQPDFAAKVEACLKYFTECGRKSVFLDELIAD